MSPFVDGEIGHVDDAALDLVRKAEALAKRLVEAFDPLAPDHAYQLFGETRITAGRARELLDACQRCRAALRGRPVVAR